MVYYTSRRKRAEIWKDGLENKKLKKTSRNFLKPLDKRKTLWYNTKVAAKRQPRKRANGKQELEKVEKTFKKYLTTAKRCGIINKLSERQIKPQGKAYVPWKLNNERREKERTNTRTIPFHEKWRKKSFVNDLGHWTENVQQSKEQMLKLLK